MSASSVSALPPRRRFLMALFALSACDVDTTPVVQESGDARSIGGGTTSPDGAELARGSVNSDYRLGPNDRLRIIVFGQPTLTGEFSIDENGMLSYPLLGNISAGGMSSLQLQQSIAHQLEAGYLNNPSVNVEVVARRPFYVIGEVQKPGQYPYVANMTVLNAVAIAGGFTYRARKNDFYIKRLDRGGSMVRVIASSGSLLRPGDTVEVRERYF